MSRYKAYAEYKDSGTDWFDSVPAHWDVKRISYFAKMRSGDLIISDQIEAEGECPVYGGNGLRGFTTDFNLNGHYVLIGRQGALCGNINYGRGKFWASEHAIVVYPLVDVNLKWLGETLRAMNLNQYNVSAAQPGLAVANIICLKIPFPTRREQDLIASFLDYETSKIDALIEKQQSLIALLKEKRQAVISHAVTKGLNPNAPMKNSGVEWLGEVPEHWDISRLKFYCSVKGRIGFRGYTIEDLVDEENGALVIGATEMSSNGGITLNNPQYISWKKYHESPEIMLKEGMILFVQRGSTVGKVSNVPYNLGLATINPSLIVLRDLKLRSLFVSYCLMSSSIQNLVKLQTSNTAIPMISQEQVGNYWQLIPPFEEQAEIEKYIYEQTEKIDFGINSVLKSIHLSQERRTALISAAVTGKIDVCNWQPS
ncbi:restriction endonuclease subunit S [Iodobacter ciconiae]|uniref:Restriction endonuclease subunit S n=1 Tax=Iodobacter ciconiae TaxID=2496266 RepID=A0A3S8ZSN5_9NEIS|nr:restriction endonuclease subunit S [Iodobacter ciconiae]AZN36507.1 restriction endonuclease subunit S [Iodobacter ciconiae]